eukprot:scaffold101686_cov33-Phaeocystis_antarctica.AAC.1
MRGGHLLGYPEEAAVFSLCPCRHLASLWQPLRLAVKVVLAAGVACERRPGHAPAADNASLK